MSSYIFRVVSSCTFFMMIIPETTVARMPATLSPRIAAEMPFNAWEEPPANFTTLERLVPSNFTEVVAVEIPFPAATTAVIPAITPLLSHSFFTRSETSEIASGRWFASVFAISASTLPKSLAAFCVLLSCSVSVNVCRTSRMGAFISSKTFNCNPSKAEERLARSPLILSCMVSAEASAVPVEFCSATAKSSAFCTPAFSMTLTPLILSAVSVLCKVAVRSVSDMVLVAFSMSFRMSVNCR